MTRTGKGRALGRVVSWVSFTARGVALSLLLLTPLAVPVAFGVVSLGMVLSVPLAAHASVLGAQPDDTKFDDAIDAAEQAWKRKDWAKSKAEFLKAEKESGSLFHDYRMHLAFVYAELGEKTLGLEQLEKFADREQEKGNLKWAESERQNPDGTDDAPKILKYAELKPRLDAMKNGEKTPPPKAASPPTPPLVAPTPAPAPQPNLEEIARRAGEIAAAAASKSTEIRMRLENAQRDAEQRETKDRALQEVERVLKLDPANTEAKELRKSIESRYTGATYKVGDTQKIDLKDNEIVIETMWIPAGVFTMGSPASEALRSDDEGPQHQVRISKGFWMMTTEVQQGQWQAVMGSTKNPNPSGFKSGPTYPVEAVSWYDAVEFANKLTEAVAKKNPQMNLKAYYTIAVSKRGENDQIEEAEVRINAEARGYRLPTEAEWEYACRAGTTGPFHFGQTISTNQANYNGNYVYGAGDKGEYRQRTTPTAFFGAAGRNAFGLYDMHGNVWEWCWDWYDAEWYKGGDRKDPIGPQTGSHRVLRGGSWDYYPGHLRSAGRDRGRPTYRLNNIGFRLCLDSE